MILLAFARLPRQLWYFHLESQSKYTSQFGPEVLILDLSGADANKLAYFTEEAIYFYVTKSFGEDLHPSRLVIQSLVISIWLVKFPLLEFIIHKTMVSVLARFQRFLSEHFVQNEL